jgi:hypothetical protein
MFIGGRRYFLSVAGQQVALQAGFNPQEITNHVRGSAEGASVTTAEAVILGMIPSWTPCVLLMAYLLWRTPFEPD